MYFCQYEIGSNEHLAALQTYYKLLPTPANDLDNMQRLHTIARLLGVHDHQLRIDRDQAARAVAMARDLFAVDLEALAAAQQKRDAAIAKINARREKLLAELDAERQQIDKDFAPSLTTMRRTENLQAQLDTLARNDAAAGAIEAVLGRKYEPPAQDPNRLSERPQDNGLPFGFGRLVGMR